MCWVSVQLPESKSAAQRAVRRGMTQLPEEQVLQVKYAGLGCVAGLQEARRRAKLGQGEQELYSIIFICGL